MNLLIFFSLVKLNFIILILISGVYFRIFFLAFFKFSKLFDTIVILYFNCESFLAKFKPIPVEPPIIISLLFAL